MKKSWFEIGDPGAAHRASPLAGGLNDIFARTDSRSLLFILLSTIYIHYNLPLDKLGVIPTNVGMKKAAGKYLLISAQARVSFRVLPLLLIEKKSPNRL